MWYFYIAVLGIIVYLTSEQRDSDNWDNLRRHYKEKNKENKL